MVKIFLSFWGESDTNKAENRSFLGKQIRWVTAHDLVQGLNQITEIASYVRIYFGVTLSCKYHGPEIRIRNPGPA